nr:immunoglobulin light chain junction region [Macaca mulatta]MOW71308.1 immunoglobulin light chain junction region [Macaca mulatta]MOW71493.1 immunoglobulin light chain junction region [Macaca mulatta]MOW71794.1 immunoglobulin light chain junction region [Macaca mulatta]
DYYCVMWHSSAWVF